MKCRHLERKLHLLLDGRLTDRDARRVKAHVADCASCRASFEALASADRALAAEPLADPPQGMAEAIARCAAAQALFRRRVLLPRWLEVFTLAGVTLALVVVGVIVSRFVALSVEVESLVLCTVVTVSIVLSVGLAAFGCFYYAPDI